jgi:hypothetical protein
VKCQKLIYCRHTIKCRVFFVVEVSFTSVEMRYSEDHPDARPSGPDVILIRIELCYFLKGVVANRSDGRATPFGRISGFQEDFCACLSVFIITLCSSIGLRRNWCRWKAKKKSYNLNIRTVSGQPTL